MAVARSYDGALRDRDFARVEALLASDVVYLSPSVVGCHQGRPAVMAMLRDFFSRHPDAKWRSEGWRLHQGQVTRRYRLLVPSATSLNERDRQGGERFSFAPDGRIQQIEVTG